MVATIILHGCYCIWYKPAQVRSENKRIRLHILAKALTSFFRFSGGDESSARLTLFSAICNIGHNYILVIN